MVRFRFGDICSCFCKPDLPGPVLLNYVLQTILCFSVQGSAKRWASGCMKAAGNKARGQQAQELKSPNLEPAFLAVPCKANYPRHVSRLQLNRKRQTYNHVGQFSSSVQKLLNSVIFMFRLLPSLFRFSGLQRLFQRENWTSGYNRLRRSQSMASSMANHAQEDDFARNREMIDT